MSNTVSIRPCDSYDAAKAREALIAVLEPIGGLAFVKPGMTIAIKVNLVTGKKPETATTTNPVLVAELTRLLMERGAKVIVGDSPGGPFNAVWLRSCYRASGMKMVEDAGAELNEDVSVKAATFTEAVELKTFNYTGWLDQADYIINFCKLKSHAMMNMTCAVKNFFGTIPGTTKPEYHMRFPDYKAFANIMIDLQEYFKPALHIVDAVECMEGNGPTSGTPRHMGLLLASRRPYYLDMVCAHLTSFQPDEVPTLMAAAERGLGPKDYAETKKVIVGTDPEEFVISDFQKTSSRSKITFVSFGPAQKIVTKATQTIFMARPRVKKKECIGCKKCYEICPAKAITMEKKKPVVDAKKCIRCFCCQEFCPVGAMKSHRNPVNNILKR